MKCLCHVVTAFELGLGKDKSLSLPAESLPSLLTWVCVEEGDGDDDIQRMARRILTIYRSNQSADLAPVSITLMRYGHLSEFAAQTSQDVLNIPQKLLNLLASSGVSVSLLDTSQAHSMSYATCITELAASTRWSSSPRTISKLLRAAERVFGRESVKCAIQEFLDDRGNP